MLNSLLSSIAPFQLSPQQIDSLLQPTCIRTPLQIETDVDRYTAALDAVGIDSFAGRLLQCTKERLGIDDPITRGLVTLSLGSIDGVSAVAA